MTVTKQNIDAFFSSKNIAVVGASAKSKKFGNGVIKELVKKNYKVFPVHHTADSFEGIKCYKSVAELPAEVFSLYIVTNKNKTNDIISEAKQKGITHIWVQQMSENDETLKIAPELNIITKLCFMMYMEPVKGMHSFHRGIKNLFGQLPK